MRGSWAASLRVLRVSSRGPWGPECWRGLQAQGTRPQGLGALAKAAGPQRQDSKPPRHSGSCPTVPLSTEMESPDDRTQATSQRGTRQRNLMAHIFILSNRCNFDLFNICRVSGLPLCRQIYHAVLLIRCVEAGAIKALVRREVGRRGGVGGDEWRGTH